MRRIIGSNGKAPNYFVRYRTAGPCRFRVLLVSTLREARFRSSVWDVKRYVLDGLTKIAAIDHLHEVRMRYLDV